MNHDYTAGILNEIMVFNIKFNKYIIIKNNFTKNTNTKIKVVMEIDEEEIIEPYFKWDREKSSKILKIEKDDLTITQKDGTNWKTAISSFEFLTN